MNNKMPISALQELMAVQKKPLPVYVEEGFGTSFKCTVHVDGIAAIGYASTKKGAKHDSAQKAIELLGKKEKSCITLAISTPPPGKLSMQNYVGQLNEMASKKGLQYPTYDLLTCTVRGEFIMSCSFSDTKTNGCGMNKKEAKQDAARSMLAIFDTIPETSLVPMKLEKPQMDMDTERVMELFKTISLNLSKSLKQVQIVRPPTVSTTIKDVTIVKEDTLYEVKEKVNRLGIEYSISEIQQDPCIMCVQTVISNHCFLGVDKHRDLALKGALLKFLRAWNIGVDMNNKISIS